MEGVSVRVGVLVRVGVRVIVGESVRVGVRVIVGESVRVGVFVRVGDTVGVADAVEVAVAVGVRVCVGVFDGVCVCVGVGVIVGVHVFVEVFVGVGVRLGTVVAVGGGVPTVGVKVGRVTVGGRPRTRALRNCSTIISRRDHRGMTFAIELISGANTGCRKYTTSCTRSPGPPGSSLGLQTSGGLNTKPARLLHTVT
jgi:hypothetical protein